MKSILFDTEMVKDILDGRKIQTMRVVPIHFEISQLPKLNANGDKNIYPFRVFDKKLLNIYDNLSTWRQYKKYSKYPIV